MDFVLERTQDLAIAATLEIVFQPLKGHAHDIAVVEPGSNARLRT